MIPKIPVEYCQQTIKIALIQTNVQDEDLYRDPSFDAPLSISHVIVQPQTIYSGSNNSREITANAVVYLFQDISQPFPVLTKRHVGSQIYFENEVYTLQKIIDNRYPFSNRVYSYELEVL